MLGLSGATYLLHALDRVKKALGDRYAIERELGAGGMATVYLAEDLKHHRKVAVKVLRPELSATIGADRFLREIEIGARFQHPHILPLHDSGEADGCLYYVMPYVAGESLKARLDREGQLPLQDTLEIARQVAGALSYAHSHDVIHRDIKPENVLLSAGHAIVADFGIARAVTAAGGDRLTETGMSIGTPAYLSPEQAGGQQQLDGRSDIYSLGCMVYEMLAGQPPFTGPTLESVVHQHMAAEVPSVAVIRPAVPPQVTNALRRAMAKAPADRFATADQFAEELGLAAAQVRLSGGLPLQAEAAAGVSAAGPQKKPLGRRWMSYGAVAVVAVLTGMIVASRIRGPGAAGLGSDAIRLTVLPFENLGAPEDEYFADGMTDEVTARLAGVAGLSIVARQSALQYKNTSKTPREIGEELDVEYLLEATISWQHAAEGPSRVRVRPQLIRTSDASHVWADVYDDDLTEVFRVQTNIAMQVVEALNIALVEPERRSLEGKPTDNLEAYDLYLQGNDYLARPVSQENYGVAEGMYRRALELDPDFAMAASRLSRVHSFMYWYYYDRTEDRLAKARDAVDSALALDPDLPEAHIALGEFYYHGRLDYERALEEFAVAGRSRPNDSGLLLAIAAVQRRQGAWQDAAESFTRASELEPRSASNALQAAIAYLYIRNYAQAEQHLQRAISFAPDELRPYVWMARLHLAQNGDSARARAFLERADSVNPRVLDPQSSWHWAVIRVLDGPSQKTLDRLAALRADAAFTYSAMAELYGLRNQPRLMRAYYDSARTVLESSISELPDEARFHSELGIAYAGLGSREKAVQEGRRAVQLRPVSREAVLGPDWVRNLARIYLMLGMHDAAVEQLEQLLSVPSTMSGHWLRLDPIWTPLRGHEGFERLLTGAN